jgi:protein-tyrosine phosphatase
MKTTMTTPTRLVPLMLLAAMFAAGGLLGRQPAAADQPKKVTPGTSLGIASLINLRDAGGYKTRDGLVVRTQLLYRSNQLTRVSPGDLKKIAALGLKTDYDLRTAGEREAAPDELPPGVKNVWLNVLADSKQDAPARIPKLLQTPREANAQLGDGKAEAVFIEAYRDFVSLPSARKAFRRLFTDLGAEDNLPALFHCTSGKDRTGWAAAALLTLLGVPDDVVMADFLRSNDYILPAYQKHIEAFTKAGGDPAIMTAILAVKAEYLKAAFDEMRTKYGTIEDYFSKALEIDAAGQKALRDRFLTHG